MYFVINYMVKMIKYKYKLKKTSKLFVCVDNSVYLCNMNKKTNYDMNMTNVFRNLSLLLQLKVVGEKVCVIS